MNETWIYKQTELNVLQWDNAMEKHYPEVSEWIHNSNKYYVKLCEECNYLDSVKLIDWPFYLGESHFKVLDMGCGGGWLTGFLSEFESIHSIYALDSSKYFLSHLLPEVIEKMNGKIDKVIPIEGLFTPILFEDHSLDVVVASSALHHADSLEVVLKEAKRVIKKDGLLFILNETPDSWMHHIARVSWYFIRILKKTIFCNYVSVSPSLSASGLLYDPYLGDKSYPLWYWKDAIRSSGFSIEDIVRTKLSTVKGLKGPELVHFVCRAI